MVQLVQNVYYTIAVKADYGNSGISWAAKSLLPCIIGITPFVVKTEVKSCLSVATPSPVQCYSLTVSVCCVDFSLG